jgi:hypothetical protein
MPIGVGPGPQASEDDQKRKWGVPLVRRTSVSVVASTLAVVAVFAANAAASQPHEGHWSGDGISFQVVHDESHARVIDMRWHHTASFAPAWIDNGEFSACYSFSSSQFSSTLFCIDGKFTSAHEATGTRRSFLVAHDGWGRSAQRERSRSDWTASLEHSG